MTAHAIRPRGHYVAGALGLIGAVGTVLAPIAVADTAPGAMYTVFSWDFPQRAMWIAAAALSATLTIVPAAIVAIRETRARSRAERDQEGVATAERARVVGSIVPLAAGLEQLSRRTGSTRHLKRAARDQMRGQIQMGVLAGLVNLYGGAENARALFYELVPSEQATSGILTNPHHFGRLPAPTGDFDRSTAEGRDVLDSLHRAEAKCWRVGMPGEVPPRWRETKSYNGWVAVPVGGVGLVHGMLTVDVKDPSVFAFSPEEPDIATDKQTVLAFANLLALAFSL